MFKNLLYKFINKKAGAKKCNFCGSSESYNNPLIAGENSYICSNCVYTAHEILFGEDVDRDDDIDFLAALRKQDIKEG